MPKPIFSIIAGKDLGISYSSLKQIGEIVPSRSFGQAGIRLYANVANGNLVVRDHLMQAQEETAPIEFSYIYNSQAATCQTGWHLGVVKKFISLPDINPPFTGAPILQEADGHETTYTRDPKQPRYLAPYLGDGTPYAFYDYDKKEWRWHDSKTGITEIYDGQGILRTRYDRAGRSTRFEYDQGQLNAIVGPTGNRYEIRRQGTDVAIYLIEEGHDFLLQLHHFDTLGRLSSTRLKDGYTINYEYGADTNYLIGIHQSDGTKLLLSYDTNHPKRLSSIQTWWDYQTITLYQNESLSNKIKATIADEKVQIAIIKQEQSYTFVDRRDTENIRIYTIGRYKEAIESSVHISSDLEAVEVNSEYLALFPTINTHTDNLLKRAFTLFIYHILQADESHGVDRSRFNYDSASQVTIEDSFFHTKTKVKLDHTRIAEVTREQGYEIPTGTDTTSYTYTPEGQLARITHPSGGVEEFRYENYYRLCTYHKKPAGEVTVFQYQDSDRPNLIARTRYLDEKQSQPIITRYVYDTNYDKHGNSFLRFVLSPLGRVKEQRPDARGNIGTVREYVSAIFDLSHTAPDIVPCLQEMQEWASKQDPSQITLSEFSYDSRGQRNIIYQYANVDAKGAGIRDAGMGEDHIWYDAFGGFTRKQQKQTEKTTTKQSQSYDELHRITSTTDALDQTTHHEYQDAKAQIITTYPNGRTKTTHYSSRGLITSAQSIVIQDSKHQEERTTHYTRDLMGHPVLTKHPDQKETYTFYDHQDRLGFSITTTGIVTEHHYDLEHHYEASITYAKRIDVKKLYLIYPPPEGILPSAGCLLRILPGIYDPKNDRCQYKFFDLSKRLHYQVDSDQYVTEIVYDFLDRHSGDIHYAERLSDDLLARLKQGQTIQLTPDFSKDRYVRYYYDHDDYQIAKQDAAGYLIEYRRDAAGHTREKILYANPQPQGVQNFADLKITPSENDAHTFYCYDARSQRIIEVAVINGQGNVTCHTYLPCGLKARTTCYLNPIAMSQWDKQAASLAALLKPSPEDQVTTHQYDLLDRETATNDSFNHSLVKAYDVMGHLALHGTLDLAAPKSTSPDCQHRALTRYDGWEQISAEANVFLAQQMAEIDADPKLTPPQKKEKKEKLWQEKSTRNIYDATGLHLRTINSLGFTTYLYYDAERRPVITIDPTGAIIESALSSFGEPLQVRHYINRVPKEDLPKLTGGFIDDALIKLLARLKDDHNDPITHYSRDRRGAICQQTDPEGFITTKSYNAFRQCITEVQPIADQKQTLTITHKFEPRGLETQTRQQSADLTAIVKTTYASPYAKSTKVIDELGAETDTFYDCLGRPITIVNALGITIRQIKYDALARPINETDALGRITLHSYNQSQRTHTIAYPLAGTKKIICFNVFHENQTITDSLGQTCTWHYAPHGKKSVFIDEIGRTTSDGYDLIGQHITHKSANGAIRSLSYDEAGHLIQRVQDTADLRLTTTYVRDALSRTIQETNPRQLVTIHTRDRNGRIIQSIKDPQPQRTPQALLTATTYLNLLSQFTYDAKHNKRSATYGDAKEHNQSYITFQHDSFGRLIGKIIDPITPDHKDGLAITTSKHLNLKGKTIAEIDANGNITRHFYDLLGQERFRIDATGSITEWYYTKTRKLLYHRIYDQPLDPSKLNDQTKLEEIIAQVKPDNLDTATWYFYDANDQERFTMQALGEEKQPQGLVKEKRYNLAGHEIQAIHYATTIAIDPSHLPTLTYEQLVQIMAKAANPAQDRITYYILDAADQERFSIDPIGVVTEKQFDALGKVILHIIYANPVDDPQSIAGLPPDQVRAKLKLDPTQDRVTYQVYDSISRHTFTVDAECAVTYFAYNEDNDQTTACQFAAIITIPATYPALVQLLHTLKPDPAKDRITQTQYDKASRKIAVIDALGHTDHYQVDALGNVLMHTDRAGRNWHFQHDRAKRCVLETLPQTTITQVSYDPKPQLTYTQAPATTKKHTTYDPASNTTAITLAHGAPQARTFNLTYDPCRRPKTTHLTNAFVDDPTKPADFKIRPEKESPLQTQTVYNAKHKIITHQNEAGFWFFTIYDSLEREIYQVDPKGAVIKKAYNAFTEEVIRETSYATPLTIDLNKYTQTGLPRAVLEANLHPSSDDRVIETYYSRAGKKELIKRSQVFYCYPQDMSYGFAQPETRREHNAFGDLVLEAKLIKPDLWSEAITWYDRNGKEVAISDPVYHIKRWRLNSFGENVLRTEYANPLTQAPTPSMTLAQLDQAITPSNEDRAYRTVYDLLGQKLQDIRCSVVIQSITLEGGIPKLSDQKPQDLIRRFTYSPTQKLIATTDAEGRTFYTYYNERGQRIAATGVPRQSQDTQGHAITLIPLTYYGTNEFGQEALTLKYKKGTTHADLKSLPTPIATDPEDQYEVTLFDRRGLKIYHQNAEVHVTAYTYQATRKIARQWHLLTNWQLIQTKPKKLQATANIDEKRFSYNPLDKPQTCLILRNNQTFEATETCYNAFQEPISEGNPNEPHIYWRYDAQGQSWSTNAEKGIPTITLKDLTGQETDHLRSPTNDLSQITYAGLPTILSWDLTRLEHSATHRDLASRVIVKTQPSCYKPNPKQVLDVPLKILSGTYYPEFGRISLTWAIPQEHNVMMKFFLWPKAQPALKQEFPLQNHVNRLGIDVSALATDVYEYQIDYYQIDPTTQKPEPNPKYGTKGQLQIETGDTKESRELVVMVDQKETGYILWLTGKTSGLTHIELWQDDQKIAQLPVKEDPKTHKILLDLKDYASGTYKLKPITSSAAAVSDDDVPFTLPFTIYTQKPSANPLSYELNCDTTLLTLYQKGKEHGQLKWQLLPHALMLLPIRFICTYLDKDKKQQTHQDTIKPDTDLGHYKDKNGHELICNTEFKHPIYEIQKMSLAIPINETEWLPIYQEEKPIIPTLNAEEVAHLTSLQRHLIIQKHYVQAKLFHLQQNAQTLKTKRKTPTNTRALQQVNKEITALEKSLAKIESEEKEASIASDWHLVDTITDLEPSPVPSPSSPQDAKAQERVQEKEKEKEREIEEDLEKDWEIIAAPKTHTLARPTATTATIEDNVIIPALFVTKTILYIAPLTNLASLRRYLQTLARTHQSQTHPEQGTLVDASQAKPVAFPYTPLYGRKENPALKYLDTTLDRFATWKTLPISALLKQGIALDVTGLAPSYYPFQFQGKKGAFTIGFGNPVYASTPISPKPPILVTPQRQYAYDAWHNVTQETNSLGYQIHYTYNIFNKRHIVKQPQVSVTNEDGSVIQVEPITITGYNARGLKIGIIDANGHTEGYFLDEAGQEITRVLAEGTPAQGQVFDALGRITRRFDARNKCWQQFYDHRNKMIKIITPSGKQIIMTYNEQSARISDTNPAGYSYRYEYDPQGNVASRAEPLGQVTAMRYDKNHELLQQDNPDGTHLIWQRDYFGNLRQHTDLGGAVYTYEYDHKHQLVHQFSQGGSHGNYWPLVHVHITHIGPWPLPQPIDYYTLGKLIPIPSQNINFTYTLGRVTKADDHATGQITLYEYDTENRRTNVQVIQNGSVIRNVEARNDAIGHETYSSDTQMIVTTGFDAVGNRRHVTGTLYLGPSNVQSQDRWWTYDAANRSLIDGGAFINGRIQITQNQGTILTYNAGFRTNEHRYIALQLVTINSQYNDDGLLTNSQMIGLETLYIGRTYDPAGWLSNYTENGHNWSMERDITCNPNGWQLSDTQLDCGNMQVRTTYSNFDTMGLPHTQHTDYKGDIHDQLGNAYLPYEDWKLMQTGGTRTDPDGTSDYTNVTAAYDANGLMIQQVNAYDIKTSYFYECNYFITTYDGLILKKLVFDDIRTRSYYLKTSLSFYTVNNQYLGSYGNSSETGTIQMDLDYINHGVGNFGGSELQQYFPIPGNAFRDKFIAQIQQAALKKELESVRFTLTDYIRSTSNTYPPIITPNYIVKFGDTFTSIAQMLYGAPEFGATIAAANGYSIMDQPIPGQVLRIPQYIAMHNTAKNFRPYEEFLSIMIGSMYPHLETPQPKEHHSFLSTLIEVVAVVVSMLVAPQLAPIIFGHLFVAGTIAAHIMVGAVAGLVDATIQGVAVGVGIQDKFSIQDVIQTAITAGLTLPTSNAEAAFEKSLNIAQKVLQVGSVAVAVQLTELAVGITHRFDIKAVMVAMAAELVNTEIDEKVLAKSKLLSNEAVEDTVNTVTGGAIGSVVYHTPIQIESLAANALGTGIGDVAGGAAAKGINKATTKTKTQHHASSHTQHTATPSHHQTTHRPIPKEIPSRSRTPSSAPQPSFHSGNAFDTLDQKFQHYEEAGLETTEHVPTIDNFLQTGIHETDAFTAPQAAASYYHAASTSSHILDSMEHFAIGAGAASLNMALAMRQATIHPIDKIFIPAANLIYETTSAIRSSAARTRLANRWHNLEQGAENLYEGLRYGDATTEGQIIGGAIFGGLTGALGGEVVGAAGAMEGAGVSSALEEGGAVSQFGRASFWGGRSAARGAEGLPTIEAVNHINGLRLQRALTINQAQSIFTETGELTPEAVQNSMPLPIGKLRNPKLLTELSARSGDLSDWAKYSTESVTSPSGNFRIHFYHNPITGEVYYGMDYKAIFEHQGNWNLEFTPNFDYQPSSFNPY